MTRAQSLRAEAKLRRQVERALAGLRADVTVGQLSDEFIGRRIQSSLSVRLLPAVATVRKAFDAGHKGGVAEVRKWL